MVRWVRLVVVVALTLAVYFVVPVRAGPAEDVWVSAVLSVGLLVGAGVLSVVQIRRSATGSTTRINGLVLAIVFSVAAFSLVGYALAVHRPGQFAGLETRLDALYFSLATLLTVGYGDVHAVGQLARALVVVQMIFGVVVIAATASMLSNRVREGMRRRARPSSGEDAAPGDDAGPHD